MVSTAVGVDVIGLQEAYSEVVQHSRFMEVAKCREVILSHQDIRVPQEGQLVVFGPDGVVQRLQQKPGTLQNSTNTTPTHYKLLVITIFHCLLRDALAMKNKCPLFTSQDT